MYSLRRLVLSNRHCAIAILAFALLMKLAVPPGFMPTVDNGKIVVSICTGTGPMTTVLTIPGREHDGSGGSEHHGKTEQPCAFSGLSAPSTAAADPILLALAILFVLALGVRAVALPMSAATPYLRPPLRGPPVLS